MSEGAAKDIGARYAYLLTRSVKSSTHLMNSSFVQLSRSVRMAAVVGPSFLDEATSVLTWVHASRYT